MRRFFLRSFLICLAPCLLAAFFAARGPYRLGIDLAGGTILVYEVNLERTQERQKTQRGDGDPQQAQARTDGLSADEMQQLAAAIKRRIDPADLRNITVRPLGSTRVEIIMPTAAAAGGDRKGLSEAEVQEVRDLISRVGVLEFRILANQTDDADAIRDARALIETNADNVLEKQAARGLAPPPPGEFTVMDRKVGYAWAELSKEERESIGLNNGSEGTGGMWGTMKAARDAGRAHLHSAGSEGKQYSMLLFSRPVHPQSPEALREVAAARRATGEGALPKSLTDGKTDAEVYAALLTAEAAQAIQGVAENQRHLVRDVGPKKFEYFVLTRVSPYDQLKIGGDVTLTASSDQDRNLLPAIGFRFNGPGANLFERMTERNKPTGNTFRSLAVVLDDKVVSAPTLNSVLSSNGIIQGPPGKGLEIKYVNQIVQILRSGALTAELRDKPVSENTMGPTLGADTIKRGELAIGLAFAAVLAFMLVYYRFAGMVACIALFANLLLTVGFMVAVNAAFTLPGLAGIVLMLGMAVDANVLIYERLREERNKGANLITAIRNGYDRAFPTIIDTHLSSIFTAVVLYTFGNDQLKGFSISLTVGLIISLFTSLYMTRLMFDFWLHKRWLTELRMLRLFERPNINFMGIRNQMFAFTAFLTVVGLAVFLARGEDTLNVDFRGGTVYGGRLKDGEERALSATSGGREGLRDLLDDANQTKRLAVTDVAWANKPVGATDFADARSKVNDYQFAITYADGPTYRVTLSTPPEGQTEAEWLADVKRRASHLPDVSVEQVFLSQAENFGEGRSRFFTVRTTEKQPQLVQVLLDRLLRDAAGNQLQAAPKFVDAGVTGATAKLTFSDAVSVNFVGNLLRAEFAAVSAEAGPGETTFDLTGVAEGTAEEQADQRQQGRFKTMTLDASKNRKFAALAESERLAKLLPPGGAVVGGPLFANPTATEAEERGAVQAKTLADILAKTKEAFGARPPYERLENFDSQLAAETRLRALLAILWSWAAILVYLWFRFGSWTFGAAAVVCLVHDLCFTLGCIAACHYLAGTFIGNVLGLHDFKIDLASVAALLTLVGYSVNDTIVVFDRIREVRGKNPKLTAEMINDSVNQTLSRTVLASLTVFLVVAVLYWFGGEGIHLFAFVMVVGVIVGTYSSIYVASPLLLLFGEGKSATPQASVPVSQPVGVKG